MEGASLRLRREETNGIKAKMDYQPMVRRRSSANLILN
jgi:hypothetical protein